MEIYRTKSIKEALSLAEKFKQEGTCDLFRGQVNDWPIKTTMQRKIETNDKQAIKKSDAFYKYLRQTVGFQHYAEDMDALDAISQHYGIPSYFLDFTSEPKVAAFFAMDSEKEDELKKDGVLICINSQEIEERSVFLQNLYPDLPKENFPYIVTPNIPNLWRLQAQKGCFLSTGIEEWEENYPIVKIYFPHSADYTIMDRDEIYPKHKSSLEIKLDTFLSEYDRRESIRDIDLSLFQHTAYISGENSSFFFSKSEPHDSWSSKNINKWIIPRNRKWEGNLKAVLDLDYDFNKSFSCNFQNLRKDILSFINKSGIRKIHLAFKFNYQSELKEIQEKKTILSDNCAKIWDGTIILPYKNKQIAYMIAKYICIELNNSRSYASRLGRNIYEFGLKQGNPGIARCPCKEIKNSYRKDWKEIVKPEYQKRILTSMTNNPQYIFDFYEFKQIFIKHILPWQVFFATDYNDAIYYSPADMEEFGLK